VNDKGSGHRDRLRKKFLLDPKYLSTYEEVELLLTYAIPRKDVQPIAAELIKRYGDLQTISSQPISDLETITGIGEAGAIYLSFIGHLLSKQQQKDQNTDMTKQQINLFDFPATQQVKPKTINLFANDEIANSLKFLSEAYTYPTKDDFEAYLVNALPYNSESTRKRRARYIMSRFISYPDIKNPLTYLFSMTNNDSVKQNALFYVIQKLSIVFENVM
jgi:DNA repair protein RadC